MTNLDPTKPRCSSQNVQFPKVAKLILTQSTKRIKGGYPHLFMIGTTSLTSLHLRGLKLWAARGNQAWKGVHGENVPSKGYLTSHSAYLVIWRSGEVHLASKGTTKPPKTIQITRYNLTEPFDEQNKTFVGRDSPRLHVGMLPAGLSSAAIPEVDRVLKTDLLVDL